MIAAAALQHIAGIAVACGDAERAARLLGASDARRAGAPRRLFTEQACYDQTSSRVREYLSEERVAFLMREGGGCTFDVAISLAFDV
jgi:hypothetical protein